MKTIINKFLLITLGVIVLQLTSCSEEFLETTTSEGIGELAAVQTDQDLMNIVNGMHRKMYTRTTYGQGYVGWTGGMIMFDSMADDVVHTGTALSWHISGVRWLNQNIDTSTEVAYPWRFFYDHINNANTIINGAAKAESTTGNNNLKEQALGEAYAYRAWCYFQLVQIYSQRYVKGGNNNGLGVVLRLTVGDEPIARGTIEEVYNQIHKDLNESISKLTGKSKMNNSHFNVNIAKGIKARVYLTQEEWTLAAQYAKEARQSYTLMSAAEYTAGFNDYTNKEWMWGSQIITDQTDRFGNYGAFMSRNFNSTTIRTAPKAIYVPLFNKFPATDIRTKNFDPTGKHVLLNLPSNFQKRPYTSQKTLAVSTSDSRADVPYMRAAEMYLIEAEALARNSKETESKLIYNQFMQNRDVGYTPTTNIGTVYINEIMDSRRIELWGEGFRWFDLKRLNLPLVRNNLGSNHIGSVINSVFEVPSTDKRWIFKIPRQEIDANPLCEQNP